MNALIASNIDLLKEILRKNKVSKAYIFGSVLNENFSNESDVDFLVQFEDNLPPLEKGELWWNLNLHDSLRDMLNREVDIVTEKSLKTPFLLKNCSKPES